MKTEEQQMSEIEKMYENAEVLMQDCLRKYYCVFDKSNKNCIVSEKCKIKDCAYLDDNSFTAEKQIAILQLLTQQCDLTISHFTEWEFIHFDGQEPLEITGKDFTETFAKLINAYWQSLTDAERTQIKNILESEVRE